MRENINVLIGCEFSGTIRDTFRAAGYSAWSCDWEEEPEGIWPEYHLYGDVRDFWHRAPNGGTWHLAILHPTCTFLANSGSKHLYVNGREENGMDLVRWALMEAGARFFAECYNAPPECVCVENPIMHKYGKAEIYKHVRYDPFHKSSYQIVQPWMFGTMETKATGLSLIRLPKLVETNNVYAEMMELEPRERARVHHASPGKNRWKDRSRTDPNLAEAMVAQWGAYLEKRV